MSSLFVSLKFLPPSGDQESTFSLLKLFSYVRYYRNLSAFTKNDSYRCILVENCFLLHWPSNVEENTLYFFKTVHSSVQAHIRGIGNALDCQPEVPSSNLGNDMNFFLFWSFFLLMLHLLICNDRRPSSRRHIFFSFCSFT